jgi:hypothetical protein
MVESFFAGFARAAVEIRYQSIAQYHGSRIAGHIGREKERPVPFVLAARAELAARYALGSKSLAGQYSPCKSKLHRLDGRCCDGVRRKKRCVESVR